MRTKDPKVVALRSIDMLAGLSTKQLRALASATDEIDVADGRTLISQGSLNRHAYFVVHGSLAVDVDGDRIATVDAGSVVGERTAIEHGPANATVRALRPARVLAVDHRALLGAADGGTIDAVLRQLIEERDGRAA